MMEKTRRWIALANRHQKGGEGQRGDQARAHRPTLNGVETVTGSIWGSRGGNTIAVSGEFDELFIRSNAQQWDGTWAGIPWVTPFTRGTTYTLLTEKRVALT